MTAAKTCDAHVRARAGATVERMLGWSSGCSDESGTLLAARRDELWENAAAGLVACLHADMVAEHNSLVRAKLALEEYLAETIPYDCCWSCVVAGRRYFLNHLDFEPSRY